MLMVILALGAIVTVIAIVAVLAALAGRLRDRRRGVTVIGVDADGIPEAHRDRSGG